METDKKDNDDKNVQLGRIIKQRRVSLPVPLTLMELAAASGVSSSHLGRIERGERYPSARILKKIAKPLKFDEDELLTIAGFMSPKPKKEDGETVSGRLDPYVAFTLGKEPPEVQYAVLSLLTIAKSLAAFYEREKRE